MMKSLYSLVNSIIFILSWHLPFGSLAQQDETLKQATLENVIQYALKNYPLIQQSQIDEETTGFAIKSKLADWYPQVNFVYNYQRNVQLQTLVFGGNTIK